MTERKWTNGPWVATATPDLSLFVCVGEDHDIIASIGTCNHMDAHLIAAAPDLYDALLRMVEIYDIGEMTDVPELDDAITALSKARGETQ